MVRSFLIALALTSTACGQANSPTAAVESVEQAVLVAANDFARGDATSWKALSSHADDVTLFGGAGGHARGWAAVGERYGWAGAAFAGGSVATETLSRFMADNLAVTVTLEQWDVRFAKSGTPGMLKLRVTHVFRREGDSWRLVHRHADPLTTTREIEDAAHLNQ